MSDNNKKNKKKINNKTNNKDNIKFAILTVLGILVVAIIISTLFSSVTKGIGNTDVAVIKIRGLILVDPQQGFGSTSTSSTQIIDLIEKAEEDENIKAIVLDINSPGGSPVASKEIADAIQRTKKPTLSIIHETGASGAYWIASSTDYIIANDLSIVGSIGVRSSYIEFAGLIKDYNMTYRRIVSAEYKDMGDPFKELKEDEKNALQTITNKIHNYFVAVVSYNRNLSMNKTKKLATGEVFLGIDSKDNGLIDQVGDMYFVKEYLKKELNATNIEFIIYEHPTGFFDILSGVKSEYSFMITKALLTKDIENINHNNNNNILMT